MRRGRRRNPCPSRASHPSCGHRPATQAHPRTSPRRPRRRRRHPSSATWATARTAMQVWWEGRQRADLRMPRQLQVLCRGMRYAAAYHRLPDGPHPCRRRRGGRRGGCGAGRVAGGRAAAPRAPTPGAAAHAEQPVSGSAVFALHSLAGAPDKHTASCLYAHCAPHCVVALAEVTHAPLPPASPPAGCASPRCPPAPSLTQTRAACCPCVPAWRCARARRWCRWPGSRWCPLTAPSTPEARARPLLWQRRRRCSPRSACSS